MKKLGNFKVNYSEMTTIKIKSGDIFGKEQFEDWKDLYRFLHERSRELSEEEIGILFELEDHKITSEMRKRIDHSKKAGLGELNDLR